MTRHLICPDALAARPGGYRGNTNERDETYTILQYIKVYNQLVYKNTILYLQYNLTDEWRYQ